MYLAWFSCGITSAVACKIAIDKFGKNNVLPIYFEINSAHPDNKRFILDCEQWFDVKIQNRKSSKFIDQFDVIEKTKYINGVAGARCTLELKKNVRFEVEKEINFDGQIFGFEFSKKEINRALRFKEQYPDSKPIFPLIDRKLTKNECAYILKQNNIKTPEMYNLGFSNNNCIGCVKGGKGYWNQIRKHFPENFSKMAKLERLIGNSCIKNSFLDELQPNEGKMSDEIMPDCGLFCDIDFADLLHPKTLEIFNN